MFRPIQNTTLFLSISYRLIASVLLSVALVVSVILVFSLEREKLLLRGFTEGNKAPTELLHALWQSRSDLIVETLLVFLVSAIGIAALVTFLHYDTTRRTLEEVKGLARNILQSIPTGVLTINREGIVSAVNPAAEAVLNRTSSGLLSKEYDAVFPETDPIRQALDEALRDHRHVSQKDFLYECGDLNPRTIRVSTAELRGDDKKPAGVILQAQDITEWLGLERRVHVAEKLAALHTLSAGVAHELRNPLSAMDLNLHLLEEELTEHGTRTEAGARYLRVLNAECRRFSGILDNFLKFARPGSLGLHEVDIRALIDHIMTLMRFEAQERQVRLEQVTNEELPSVLGDETQISQVLVNIVVNAFHAMPNGGLCRISAMQREAEGKRWVEIAVKDSGVGIAKKQLSRLFEPFYTTKPSGTGLGLAIAYRIMQDHGGTIQVSSAPGSGTTVVTQFPAAIDQPQKVGVRS
ncbi:MAG: Periplasmic sensor signal transduction histidine kinase [Nitrospira sp.]|jgi:PAS domain S-box-containing protein|nr:Periplasmic sensor signal transduction histidine kinase [Nitrospira sp.]